MIYDYDLVVIGGGPGGYVAAISAAKAGKRVCLCEKKTLGGVCLNEGCIPTKTLLKSVNFYSQVKNSSDFGINIGNKGTVSLRMADVQKRKQAVVDTLVSGIRFLIKAQRIDYMNDTAVFTSPHSILCGTDEISFDNAIIATGSEVSIPPVEILEGAPVMISSDVLNLNTIPDKAAVIGGGVVGVELAFLLSQAGAEITILEQMDRILPMLDTEVASAVIRELNKKGIQIHTDVKVTSIGKKYVKYEDSGKALLLDVDSVILATGRRPSFSRESMDAAGVYYDHRAIPTDSHMRTNVPHIYAIGDVNGKAMLAHTASAEAEVAVRNICGISSTMNYETIPYCIYLEPEIACIGLTEEQARMKYPNIKIGKFPLMANGKALIENHPEGIVKTIIDSDTDKIIGFHMYGIHSTDMIACLSTAMTAGVKGSTFSRAVFPHPTVSESIHESFLNAYGISVHI